MTTTLLPEDLATLTDDELLALTNEVMTAKQQDRKEWQLCYYRPASKEALKIHTSLEHLIGIGGGNRCLPLDAPVLMADGTWKELGKIEIGEWVIGIDERGEHGIPVKVLNVFRSGQQPVWKFTCSDHTTFRVTADHQVPLYLGSGRKTTKGHKKLPRKRRIGDYLNRTGTLNVSKRIAAIQPQDIKYHDATPENWDIDFYLLGVLLGDGTFSGALRLSCANTAVLERAKAIVHKYDCDLIYYGQYDYGISGKMNDGTRCLNRVREAIKSMGLWGCTSYTKFVPRFVFSLPRMFRRKVLEGLIDSDGGLNSFCTCSLQLSRDFEQLVHSLGGKVTTTRRSSKSQDGKFCESYQSYWRINQTLELACPEKQGQGKRPVDYQRKVLRSVEPVGTQECGDIEVDHPGHCYITEGYTIVSNSGKTDTNLAEAAIQATGIIPDSLKGIYPREKLRGPITVRVVCESHTTTLAPVILHKLNYSNWNGVDVQGGERGHWGWIPKACLLQESWDKSWKESKRQLTVLCRDPDDPDVVLGESVFQFMSHDQEPAKFASGEFHLVVIDEPPKYAIYRENRARIMSVGGRMLLGMTWPDDPTIPVDWIFDEIYDIGQAGPKKHPDVKWIELNTLENPNIDQESVRREAAAMSELERACRIGGKPIRFSNMVHPLFTDTDSWWCFTCNEEVLVNDKICSTCGSSDTVMYNHVQDFRLDPLWPTVFLLDPHPRKPHMFQYWQVDANDDYSMIFAGECAGDPDDLKKLCDQIERELGVMVAKRLVDPNMGRSPASSRRGITWQDEFAEAGLYCDLANDSDVGRGRVDEYLKPDRLTGRTRIRFLEENCAPAIYQFKRYSWDDFRNQDNKDQKQTPKQKYDDHPTLCKYLLNEMPLHSVLKYGGQIIKPRGRRVNGY